MTKTGQRLVPKRGNKLRGFTAFKSYEVIAGTGDANMSPVCIKLGMPILSENAANVLDDNGELRFVTLDFFRDFKDNMGLF